MCPHVSRMHGACTSRSASHTESDSSYRNLHSTAMRQRAAAPATWLSASVQQTLQKSLPFIPLASAHASWRQGKHSASPAIPQHGCPHASVFVHDCAARPTHSGFSQTVIATPGATPAAGPRAAWRCGRYRATSCGDILRTGTRRAPARRRTSPDLGVAEPALRGQRVR